MGATCAWCPASAISMTILMLLTVSSAKAIFSISDGKPSSQNATTGVATSEIRKAVVFPDSVFELSRFSKSYSDRSA